MMADGKYNAVNDRPKVSVIVPVYNMERYLQRCIDSLQAQTYPNIEYIFVDDGSKDASVHILRAAEQNDNRICVIEQKNAGPSAARNKGIDHSTGKYIMFCDSDDTVTPDWCEIMVNTIESSPYSWIVCGIRVLTEEGTLISDYVHANGSEKLSKEEYFRIFTDGLSAYVYNKIYRATVIRDKKIRFDEEIRRGEDVKFNLAYLDQCSDIFIVKDILYSYYRYEEMETLTSKKHIDDFSVHAMLYRLRDPYITERYRAEFQWWYWALLSNEIENIMSVFTDYSILGRMKICSENIKSEEYKELLATVGYAEMPQWQYQLLKSGLFYLYWLARVASIVKGKLLRLITGKKME